MNKKRIISALQLIISIILILILFSRIDVGAFLNLLKGIKPGYFSLGVLCYLLSMIIITLRWLIILRTANESVGFVRLLVINFISSFFSMFLPTAVGGDVARMYETSREGMMRTKAVSTVLLDRVIGLMSLVLISVAALLVGHRYMRESSLVYLITGLTVAFGVAWRLFFTPRVMHHFKWVFHLPLVARGEAGARSLYQSLYDLYLQPRLLLSTLVISVAAQAIEILSAIFLARALDVQSDAFYFFIFIPLIWLVTMIPVSLNGLGLRESAFTFFFGQIGVLSTEAVSLSLLVYSCRLLASLLGGGLFLRSSMEDSVRKWFK